MNKLKPCPFCGGSNIFEGNMLLKNRVKCRDCNYDLPIKQWNNRPREQALQAKLDTLRLAYDDFDRVVNLETARLQTRIDELEDTKMIFRHLLEDVDKEIKNILSIIAPAAGKGDPLNILTKSIKAAFELDDERTN